MTDPFGPPSAGPMFASGEFRSNGRGYDPAPSVQGCTPLSQAVTSTTVGATSLAFPNAAATALVFGGQQLYLSGGATPESVWVASNWTPGSSASVPLTAPLAQAGNTSAAWAGWSSLGPVNNAFYGQGLPAFAPVVFDGTSKFALQRAASVDGLAVGQVPVAGAVLWNGASYDRPRGNLATSLLASSAQSVNYTSADQTNYNGAMLHLIVNVTAVSGTTPSMTVSINGKDPASNTYYPLLSSAAITGTGQTVLKVGPGFPVAANASANDLVPRIFQVTALITGTTPSFTMSLGYNLNE